MPREKLKELDRLSESISSLIGNKHYHSYSKLDILPEVNKKCFVQIDESQQKPECYRGVIEHVDFQHEKCKVRILDTGVFKMVPFYNVYPHKRLQDGTAKLHYRAIRCCIKPGDTFHSELQAKFRDVTKNRYWTFDLVEQINVNGVKCWYTKIVHPDTKANILDDLLGRQTERKPSRPEPKPQINIHSIKNKISQLIDSNTIALSPSVEEMSRRSERLSSVNTQHELGNPVNHHSRPSENPVNRRGPMRPRSKSADSYSNFHKKSSKPRKRNKRNQERINFAIAERVVDSKPQSNAEKPGVQDPSVNRAFDVSFSFWLEEKLKSLQIGPLKTHPIAIESSQKAESVIEKQYASNFQRPNKSEFIQQRQQEIQHLQFRRPDIQTSQVTRVQNPIRQEQHVANQSHSQQLKSLLPLLQVNTQAIGNASQVVLPKQQLQPQQPLNQNQAQQQQHQSHWKQPQSVRPNQQQRPNQMSGNNTCKTDSNQQRDGGYRRDDDEDPNNRPHYRNHNSGNKSGSQRLFNNNRSGGRGGGGQRDGRHPNQTGKTNKIGTPNVIHRFANESYIVECADEEDDQNSSAYNDVFVEEPITDNDDDDQNNDDFDDAKDDFCDLIDNEQFGRPQKPIQLLSDIDEYQSNRDNRELKFGVINKGGSNLS